MHKYILYFETLVATFFTSVYEAFMLSMQVHIAFFFLGLMLQIYEIYINMHTPQTDAARHVPTALPWVMPHYP